MLFFAIILINFISGAEIDICVSSLPEIKKLFGISYFKTEMILGVNLIFHAFGIFVLGLYGDTGNKEKMINIGMIIFTISSFFCAVSTNFNLLLLWRAIQGLSIAAPACFSGLLIFEYFKKEEHDSRMSKLNGFATIGVSLAPVIGSMLTSINWRLNFVLLGIMGIVNLIIFDITIKKTKKLENKAKNKKVESVHLLDYLPLFKSKKVMIYIMTTCIGIASYYSFAGIASIIYIDGFGVDIRYFGFYQSVLVLSFALSSLLNPYAIKKIGERKTFFVSLSLMLLFFIGNIYIIWFNVKNPNIVTMFLSFWSIGVAYPFNKIYVKSLKSLENHSSKISSLLTLFKWLFSVFGFQLASTFYSGDFRASGIIIIVFYIFVFSGWYFLHKKDKIFY